ncbi:hypothetical protein LSH36_31g02064 [Paralvinella palmiformis]|uniref:Uncharacterized protein n=1 Tax=Paralvinella palmiformis TaxID=53620 RepID=A0AAD9K8Y7_9ANNE|nr:hypothetical protein LSH36_31g02064 [Paralvinella palmiformis]
MGCGLSLDNQPSGNDVPISGTKNRKKKHKELEKTQIIVPKSVAFDIQFDNNNIESILNKHPPKRLKRLQPLENAPKLSAEMLEEKLRQAEEKRKQQIEVKKAASKRVAKFRENLERAKELEKHQQVQQAAEIKEKLQSAGKNREAKLRDMEEKFRIKEERARQARERAKTMKQSENGLEFDVEKDENFNADDDDSWFEDDKKTPNLSVNKPSQQTEENSHLPSTDPVYNGVHLTSSDQLDDMDDFFDS